MANRRLILCVCGAGVNTSHNASLCFQEYLPKVCDNPDDYEIKFCQVDQMSPYKGRDNMVVCWMTQIDETFGSPSVQGLTFLVGGKKAKEELVRKTAELMESIYKA